MIHPLILQNHQAMVIQQESLILQVLQFCTCFFQKNWLIRRHLCSHILTLPKNEQ